MTSVTLLDVSGAVPESVVQGVIAACKANSFELIQTEVTNSIADGWPVSLSPPKRLEVETLCLHTAKPFLIVSYWSRSWSSEFGLLVDRSYRYLLGVANDS